MNDPLMIRYHDEEWGVPLHDDLKHFEFFLLDCFQAGLSWRTVLYKRDNFRKAFDGFNFKKIARYDAKKIESLLSDPGIIRNRLKINAAIENAKVILALQKEYGSFDKWLEMNFPKTLPEWVKLFRKTFSFTGGEIVNEFLSSIGYLPALHDKECPAYKKIINKNPMWMRE